MKRLLQLVPILFIVSVIIFSMVRLSNIDPVSLIVGSKRSTPEIIAQVKEKYNFNKPLPVQYGIWLSDLLKGDMGDDYKNKQSIASLISQSLPVTAGLVLFSSIIALLVAVPIGIITAVRKNTWIDKCLSIITLVFVSAPGFLTGIIMILVFSHIAPSFSFTGSFSTFGEYIQRLAMPSLVLAFGMIALISRITRSSMIEEHQSSYRLTATAKGLPSRIVILKHCLKNALIPVITVFGIQIGTLISGAVIVENVFSLSGVGSLLINGINDGNYPVVQDVTIILVAIFLFLSLLVDIIYAAIDPRIRYNANVSK
jgi:ABC-type dipeptide/oligopeptide/nickel transport systems, permease components